MSTVANVETRPLRQLAGDAQETGNPTTTKQQKGTPMSTTLNTYRDDLEIIENKGLLTTPASLEDLRSRPNVEEYLDLNGDTDALLRKIVDRRGWCVEENHVVKSADGPAETSYSIHVRVDGLSPQHLRYHLTTILALLPADPEAYTAALTTGDE